MGRVGASDGAVARHAGARKGTGPNVVSPILPDFRTSLVKWNKARFASNGHGLGRYDADVYVNAEGKDACMSARVAIPVGTRIVMEHVERGGQPGPTIPGPMMMMEKKPPGFDADHGDWRYVGVDANGVQDGALDACKTCHDEAPHDHVFSLPQ
jgi:hypothetical protein